MELQPCTGLPVVLATFLALLELYVAHEKLEDVDLQRSWQHRQRHIANATHKKTIQLASLLTR